MKTTLFALSLALLAASPALQAAEHLPLHACRSEEKANLAVLVYQEEATGDFYAVKENVPNDRPERLLLRDAQGHSIFASDHYSFSEDFSSGAETDLSAALECESLDDVAATDNSTDASDESQLKAEPAAFKRGKKPAKKPVAKPRRSGSYDYDYYPAPRKPVKSYSYEYEPRPRKRVKSYSYDYAPAPRKRVKSYSYDYSPAPRKRVKSYSYDYTPPKRKRSGSYEYYPPEKFWEKQYHRCYSDDLARGCREIRDRIAGVFHDCECPVWR